MATLHKTHGIVLRTTRFGETSMVVRVYTELFGIQSYIINGVHTKKPRVAAALLQPLTPLDMVVYHKDAPTLQRASEVRPAPPLTSVPYQVEKLAIAQFMAELLDSAIQEVEANADLHAYLLHFVEKLDSAQQGFGALHLHAMVQFSALLGFGPVPNYTDRTPTFDLREGVFLPGLPSHPNYVVEPLTGLLAQLMTDPAEKVEAMRLTRSERSQIMAVLLDYYRLHLQGFRPPQSQHIFEQVFGF